MTSQRLKFAGAVAAFIAILTAATPSFARDDCYRWSDSSDRLRCFDCMKTVWSPGQGWHRVNTCAPRRFPPG